MFCALRRQRRPAELHPGEPAADTPDIVPEWYFLPFYAILRSVPSKLIGVLMMFSSILVLFIVPWLDTSPVRSAKFRPIYKKIFWLLLVSVLVLGYVGAHPPEGVYVIEGRIAAFYYLRFPGAAAAGGQAGAASTAAAQYRGGRA